MEKGIPIATPFYYGPIASFEKVLDTTHFKKKENRLSPLCRFVLLEMQIFQMNCL